MPGLHEIHPFDFCGPAAGVLFPHAGARGALASFFFNAANANRKPLNALLAQVCQIPGYREDPLQKKSMRLATMLENRPERFLRVTDPELVTPIVDYHIQRSAPRTRLFQPVYRTTAY